MSTGADTAVLLNVLGFFNNDIVKTVLWFKTANPQLGGIAPIDMIRLGRLEKLADFVKTSLAENDRADAPVPTERGTVEALCARAHDAEALLREEHHATLCMMIPLDKIGRRDGVTAPVRMCPPEHLCWWCKVDMLLEKLPPPERKILRCPSCRGQHIDRGHWATSRIHRTHLCEHCGCLWRPFVYPTVGVEKL